MKNVLRFLIIAAAFAAFALPAFAQGTTSGSTTTAMSAQDAQAKVDLYNKFLSLIKGGPAEQKQAADVGREYISKYGSLTDEADKKVAAYVQNWVAKYDAAVAEFEWTQALENNPTRAFQMARQKLSAPDADELRLQLQLTRSAVRAAQKNPADKSFYGEALSTMRRALQLIESGKTTDNWGAFTNQQEAVEGLNYYIGFFTLDSSPEESVKSLLKVAQSSGTYSKQPTTFQWLGHKYYAELAKLVTEYKRFENQPETPESKALFDKINVVMDRTIDAYARAIALSGNKPEFAGVKSAAMPILTSLYKQRHENSTDANVTEYVASVLQKPLPIPGQEPQPTPAPSPSSSNANGTGGTAPATTTTPASGTAVSQPASSTNTGAKPAASTPPASSPTPTPKPKP